MQNTDKRGGGKGSDCSALEIQQGPKSRQAHNQEEGGV